MASRKEYEMLFQLNAQLGSSYTSTFKNAQSSITSMQNEIAALSKIQSDISSYQKQQDAVERTRQKLGVLQQQYDNIQKEIQETGTFSSNLENKLLAKQLQIDKTAASLDNQTQKLEAMGVRLRDAGIDVGNLTEESSRLTSEMEQLKESQVEAADEAANFGTTASQAFAAAGQALVAAGITVALKEIYEWFGSAVQASVEFESAMTGVAKTTDMSSEELAAMAREIRLLSTEIPITTTEFAGIAEVAGQLGIAKENLLDFSTTMAMLATATTMTAEEAATLLAQFANITQMDSAYYSNLASTIVELGNNFATTEQKITQMAQGIAAAGSLAGMSEADMVALSAAVTSLGIETQAGASSMSRLIQQLNTAVETGDQLEEFASIAGMTGEEFKKAWGEDAVRALEAFVIGLADTERNGKSANVALQELGITEIRMQRMILSLANSGDLLNRTIETANKAWEENTALVTEAELRYGTTESQLTLMQNAYNNLKIVIGDQFTPELRKLYALQTDVLKTVTDYLEQNPELIKAVTTFVGVIGIAVGGLTGYVAITKLATVVSTAFAAAIPGVNVIMGVAVAIAGLTAGIVALNEASNKYVDESWSLTAASRMQYQRIQELTAEYEKAVETYGETSYEAQSLKWKLEELTTEYELSKQKLVEYKAAHEALVKSYVEMTESHAKATEEIEKEQLSTLALIAKLEELTATTDSATENQQAILGVIKALNRQMPELALNYEDVTQSSKGYIESLKAMAQAQAEQARLEAQWAEYIDRVGQQESLRAAKEAAELNAQLAQEEYDLALKAYNEALDLYKWDPTGVSGWFGTLDEAKVLNVAKEQLELYNSVLEETTLLYEENSAAIAELEEAFNAYQKSQEEGIATGENLAEVINDVRARMKELATAYQEAYDAAMESISGQYKLWDEAAEVVAKSAGEINYALATQAQYWADYRTNLESLTARSEDIEGLSELLATFADGSEESVNVIAGLAMATDSELRAMVANWQAVKAEQEIVAQSLAQLQTDFAAAMSALQQELETVIGEMNLTEEAAESGKNTIEGFIQGSEDMLPAVREAYERIAKAAIAAIDAQLQIESPSRVFAERGRFAMSGFVDGVSSMESEVLKTLSQIASDGVGALSVEAEVSQEASYPERVSLDAVMPAGITEIPRTWVESQAKLASLVEREAHIENMSEFLASLADSGRSSFNVIAGLSVVSEELGSVLSNWRAIQTNQEMVVADWARLGTDVKSVIEAVRAEGIGGSDAVFAAMATPVTQETGVVARNDALRPIQVVSAQTAPATSGVRIPPIQITYNITGVSNVEELEDALRTRDVELKRTLMDILEEIQIERERGAYV